MGRYGVPCIGFGPGAEAQAHAPNEKTWKADLGQVLRGVRGDADAVLQVG